MKCDAIINLVAFVVALIAIGVGVAAHDWAAALVVVGVIVLCTVVASRVMTLREPVHKPPAQEATNESA